MTSTTLSTLAFFGGSIGWTEVVIIAVVALLLFGRRLPEVGKSLGKGIVEFKKGLKGVSDEVEQAGQNAPGQMPTQAQYDQRGYQAPAALPPQQPMSRGAATPSPAGASARRSDLVD